MKSDFGLTN